MEPTPGSKSSEFMLAKLVFYAGLALDAAGILLAGLSDVGLAENKIVAGGLVVVGMLTKLVALLGYVRSRTLVKLAELAPKAVEVAKEAVPLATELAAEVKAGQPTPPSESPQG